MDGSTRLTILAEQLKPEEMKAISSIVSGDAAAKDKAFAEGLYVAGTRFVLARAEDRSIYARSVRYHPS
jgi:profilin